MGCKHDWFVFAIKKNPDRICVFCRKCDALGDIYDFTDSEFYKAVNSYHKGYRWTGRTNPIVK